MAAIFEMLGALLGAILEVSFVGVQLVCQILAALLEFAVISVVSGRTAAETRYTKRRQERNDRLNSPAAEVPPDSATNAEIKTGPIGGNFEVQTPAIPSNDRPVLDRKAKAIVAVIVLITIACVIAGLMIEQRITQQRRAVTEIQIQQLARGFVRKIRDKKADEVKPGKLPDRDAWGTAIELFVDRFLAGTLIVVRSAGAGRKTGSIDDMLEIEFTGAPGKQIGGELMNRGVKLLRDRVVKLLPNGDKMKIPAKIDVDEK